jgi:hypothetical protein
MRVVLDLESDGLLDVVTKIHCLCYYDIDTKESVSLTDYNDIASLVTNPNLTLICHNSIRFDVPVLEQILDIKITGRVIDTLPLSWYLYPNRERHGLAFWGEEFGVPKPIIENWKTQTLAEYIHRCEEDVKINTKLFLNMVDYLILIYEDKDINSIINYLMFKMQCAREQEVVKWRLDVKQCEKNLELLSDEKIHKREALSSIMPEYITYNIKTKPKKPYKADGTYSIIGEKWFQLLEEKGLDEDFDGEIESEGIKDVGNPNSSQQLKEWLFSLGWKPITFKFEKEEDGTIRKIPQINLPMGQGICESVKDLYEVQPGLDNLDKYSVLSHRIGLLKGFLKNVDNEGYLQAQVQGLANTLRFKHTTIVNLPGVDKNYGEYIRSCLIAPEGKLLCGSDMVALENRTGEHYMYYFDPQYVIEKNTEGFDPHTDIAVLAGLMTKDEEKFFKWYKNS